ncbi:Uncharacterised protein [Zhongshania aliphaticivorans]|uniref:DUF6351 domain-containing protein n=1 Tax=Zhongshania aliphaticivorans TaxID=1470434 RepID=A0A5S9NB37_9GAMM|nr:DUF6351 family protein [Zhongshania aliphaticivorans]CAA0078896.1 Uncharacterised protein [Zhongshania aliphaticivorans]CAA0086464.1 Uncharacterised protein [Zhongshania aliphaticivorans]
MKLLSVKLWLIAVCVMLSTLLLSACGGSGDSGGGLDSNPVDTVGDDTPNDNTPVVGEGQIRVLSNRSDLISGGNALIEVIAEDTANLDGVIVTAGGSDISHIFAARSDGRLMGLVEGLALGDNEIVATLADQSVLTTTIVNHPNGGPVFSGPQVQPWTCTNDAALDAQCNQAAEYSFKYVPANRLQALLTSFDPASMELPPAFLSYDPANPPAESDIAMTTTDNGEELPFIVRVERGVQNRDRYQIMTLFQPGVEWTPFAPQSQWNGKLLIHHGGNVGVSYGPGNPPNGDISGTAPDGGELLLGDSITVALSRGFLTLSTAQSNLGHNVNLVTSAESLMMAKEHIVETYGELRYTIGTGCSGGAIAQQHVANAYPGIYQGLIVQCSYPDAWTTATQFADYNLLNTYFGSRYPTDPADFNPDNLPSFNPNFIPFIQWSLVYGHLPLNPIVSDLAFFPSAYPDQENCSGLRDAVPVYNAETKIDGLRCGIIDYMKTQFGTRTEDVWSQNEQILGYGYGGIPLDNIGVQYGLSALQEGAITADQFLDLNQNIGGFTVDVRQQPERITADPLALSNAYKTGAINTAEHLSNVAIIDLRGADPGIAHDAYHSWQMRARLEAKQGHFDNHVIWFGQIPLAGDTVYSSEALVVMDDWMSAIEADASEVSLAEKVVANKPAAARDRCLSVQTLLSDNGPIIPFTGNLLYPTPIVPIPSTFPSPPPEAGVVFDQVANQACGLDASAYDSSGASAQLTEPLAELQHTLVQTRFGTPRTVAGDGIETWNNKCQLRPVDPVDYAANPLISDVTAFVEQVRAIFPDGVCDYSQAGVGTQATQTWLEYGTAEGVVIGGQPLPPPPQGSRTGWASAPFELSR